jgi:predicted DNA-binding protein
MYAHIHALLNAVKTYLQLNFQKGMLACMEGKTKNFSFRVPADLAERLERLKIEQAHKQVDNSKFLVEAVKLYLKQAEQFGLDDNLVVKEAEESYGAEKRSPRKSSKDEVTIEQQISVKGGRRHSA